MLTQIKEDHTNVEKVDALYDGQVLIEIKDAWEMYYLLGPLIGRNWWIRTFLCYWLRWVNCQYDKQDMAIIYVSTRKGEENAC